LLLPPSPAALEAAEKLVACPGPLGDLGPVAAIVAVLPIFPVVEQVALVALSLPRGALRILVVTGAPAASADAVDQQPHLESVDGILDLGIGYRAVTVNRG
jgi:hypothetical protein